MLLSNSFGPLAGRVGGRSPPSGLPLVGVYDGRYLHQDNAMVVACHNAFSTGYGAVPEPLDISHWARSSSGVIKHFLLTGHEVAPERFGSRLSFSSGTRPEFLCLSHWFHRNVFFWTVIRHSLQLISLGVVMATHGPPVATKRGQQGAGR